MFFFEKKNQKTFAPLRAVVAQAVPTPTGIKVFFASFLFTKKKTLLAFLLYSLIAIAFLNHGEPLANRISGFGGDPAAYIWFLDWWPWAVLHHQPLWHTALQWQPVGVYLAWVTSIPLLALLCAPITLTAGPVVSYNLLVLACPVLAAWGAFALCLKLTARFGPALAGGYLFGFSSYEMAQNISAPNLTFTVLVPLLVLLALHRLEGRLPRGRFVLLAALALSAEFYISAEIAAMLLLFGGAAWVAALACFPARRAALLALVTDGVLAAPLVLLATWPALGSMLAHRDVMQLPENFPYFFTADPENLIVPAHATLIGSGLYDHYSGHAFHFPQEEDAYLGLPLIALLVWYFRHNATPVARFLRLMLLITFVASLGPALWIFGYFTGVPLPWALMLHVPLLHSALPDRLFMFTTLAIAVAAALFMAAGDRRVQALGWLACLSLLPAPYPWMSIPSSPLFAPGRIEQILGPAPKLLILPFYNHGPGTYWQMQNQFGFSETGGYLGSTPAPMQSIQVVQDLLAQTAGPGFGARLAAFLQQTGTDAVIAAPGTPAPVLAALRALHWQTRQVDDVLIFTVPRG
jgi:hypothetical protein